METIHRDIESVKKAVAEIREHMVDVDSIMTEDDYRALEEYKREKSGGNLTSHEGLKKELGL